MMLFNSFSKSFNKLFIAFTCQSNSILPPAVGFSFIECIELYVKDLNNTSISFNETISRQLWLFDRLRSLDFLSTIKYAENQKYSCVFM
jgi:hypothetical protein